MRCAKPLLTLLAVGSVSLGGCAKPLTTGHLRDIAIDPIPPSQPPLDPSVTVLVRKFADNRADEYSRALPMAKIPIVNLIMTGSEAEYPEHTGLATHKKVRRVGGFDQELPCLLSRLLPAGATCSDEHPEGFSLGDADYIVDGRVLEATATGRASFLLVLPSLIGIPAMFSRQRLRFELAMFHRGHFERPVFRKTYRFDERMAEGLYYHHGSARKLFRKALRQTVRQAATDLAAAMARHRSSGRR